MNIKVQFSKSAIRDVNSIFDYIYLNAGENIARNYVEKIQNYCLSFATFPERGTLRSDLRSNLRLVPYKKSIVIAFIYVNGIVTILRVFGRGQNIEAELS